MKKRNVNKKITLNKVTVSHLQKDEMRKNYGRGDKTEIGPSCDTGLPCCNTVPPFCKPE